MVRNCSTLAMTNKLVIINSLKVPKIKKIVLYEMKFLVPNYSCIQNPWLGATAPTSPFSLSSVLNWIFWTPTPEQNSWVRHCSATSPFSMYSRKIFERKVGPRNMKMVVLGDLPKFTTVAMRTIQTDFDPLVARSYCTVTATVRRPMNIMPQQFCNVSCSCVLRVCSVLQTVL